MALTTHYLLIALLAGISGLVNASENLSDLIAEEATQKDVRVEVEQQPKKRELDPDVASTDLHAQESIHGGHGNGKYFMYAHQPDKKQYEFGFKRGNDHHSVERYEKGGPHHNFKTKVRWHDSKGGHGEHYWDYNHAPKHHDDHHDHHDGGYDHHGGYSDHHGHQDGGYGHGGHHDHGGYHSEPIPDYASAASSVDPALQEEHGGQVDSLRLRRKTSSKNNEEKLQQTAPDGKKSKRTQYMKESKDKDEMLESKSAFPALIGYDPYQPPLIANPSYNFKPSKMISPSVTKGRKVFKKTQRLRNPPPLLRPPKIMKAQNRQDSSVISDKDILKKGVNDDLEASSVAVPKLAFDLETGRVYDEVKNVWYDLVLSQSE